MKTAIIWAVTFVVLLFAVAMTCPAQDYASASNVNRVEMVRTPASVDMETDIVTEQGNMIKTGNNAYTVTLTGVTMRQAVDYLVDQSIEPKLPTQTFDQFTITYDLATKTYTINDRDESFFTATNIGDVKKELKRVVKLALDNL